MKKKQIVLVTGSTRGIGKETALHLARRGHRVVATGRNQALLGALSDEALQQALPLVVMALDVIDGSAVKEAVAQVLRDHGSIDALVNNAGYGLWGSLEELDLEEVRSLFETNVFSSLRLAQAVLPHMRERGWGTIVNVGSVAGQIATPMEGAYSASKFALRAMSRAMRVEVERFGVRVVLIEPGVIRTDFHANRVVGRKAGGEGSPYAATMAQSTLKSRARALAASGPGRVAMRIGQVIEGRRLRPSYAVGLDACAGVFAARFFPDAVLDFFLGRATLGR